MGQVSGQCDQCAGENCQGKREATGPAARPCHGTSVVLNGLDELEQYGVVFTGVMRERTAEGGYDASWQGRHLIALQADSGECYVLCSGARTELWRREYLPVTYTSVDWRADGLCIPPALIADAVAAWAPPADARNVERSRLFADWVLESIPEPAQQGGGDRGDPGGAPDASPAESVRGSSAVRSHSGSSLRSADGGGRRPRRRAGVAVGTGSRRRVHFNSQHDYA